MLPLAIAVGLSALGPVLLHRAWRVGHHPLAAASWLLALLALAAWCAATGVEFGLIYGLTVPALVALALTGVTARDRGGRPAAAPALREVPRPAVGTAARTLAKTVLVLPVAGIASGLGALAIGYLVTDSPASRLAAAGLVLPLLWGLAACWLTAAPRPGLPVAVVALVAALSALLLGSLAA